MIDHISHDAGTATDHASALAAMNSDGDVGVINDVLGSSAWYFRDVNHNGIPDIDTPYFFHEGDVVEDVPFTMGMMRLRNIYFYVNGNMTQFKMGTGSGINRGQVYLIASGDVASFDMMNMSMTNAGVVVIAGNDITNVDMMQGTFIGELTMFANHDIKLTSGFSMSLGKRMRLLSANDVTSVSGFNMSGFTTGSSSSHCGCTGGYDETTDFAIGRRFNG